MALVLALWVTACGGAGPDAAESPTAEFVVSCAGLACEFEPSSPSNEARDVDSWHWSFGDGASSTSQNPSHVFDHAGVFEVSLTVRGGGATVTHRSSVRVVQRTTEASLAPVELSLGGASAAGTYVTRWDHRPPRITLSIGDGWWVVDRLTAVSIGRLTERETQACFPYVRIDGPKGRYDPVADVIVPIGDVAEALQADPRIRVAEVESVNVGGYPAVRIDGTASAGQTRTRSWWCDGVRHEMLAFAALEVDDPAYLWTWVPIGAAGLTVWVVDVDGDDMVIVASFEDGEAEAARAVDAIVGSIEFHPALVPQLTKTLRSEFGDIDIHSGTYRLHAMIEWAVASFGAAGIGSPGVASATFSADVECHERGYAGGFSEAADGGYEIHLCFGEERPQPSARTTVLHEFAHAWMATHLEGARFDEFVRTFDLPDWGTDESIVREKGAEYAADVIAWGLQSDPVRPVRLGDWSCASLAEAFRVLTGSGPLTDLPTCDR